MSHYSLTNKFIFIHVPKTGGVAMLDYLSDVDDLSKVQDLRDDMGKPRSGWDDNHYYYKTTIDTLSATYHSTDFSQFSIFGVVRNPYDRMVSMYLHRLRKPKYNTADDNRCLARGFEYWLHSTRHRADNHITNRSQLEWYDGCSDVNLICQSKLNTEWLREVSNTTDSQRTLPIKHTSNKAADTYKSYHTVATVKYIKSKFARDIEWGSYEAPIS